MIMKVSDNMKNYKELLNDLLSKLYAIRKQYHKIKINITTYTDLTIIQVDLTDFCTSEFIIIFGIDEISFYRNGSLIVTGLVHWCGYEVVEIIIRAINDICDDLYESE